MFDIKYQESHFQLEMGEVSAQALCNNVNDNKKIRVLTNAYSIPISAERWGP